MRPSGSASPRGTHDHRPLDASMVTVDPFWALAPPGGLVAITVSVHWVSLLGEGRAQMTIGWCDPRACHPIAASDLSASRRASSNATATIRRRWWRPGAVRKAPMRAPTTLAMSLPLALAPSSNPITVPALGLTHCRASDDAAVPLAGARPWSTSRPALRALGYANDGAKRPEWPGIRAAGPRSPSVAKSRLLNPLLARSSAHFSSRPTSVVAFLSSLRLPPTILRC